nr:MAG TPA: hypothetical protein [Caudoviricetes sp.]
MLSNIYKNLIFPDFLTIHTFPQSFPHIFRMHFHI